MCTITAWRHSRLRAHWPMALVGGGGLPEGEACILRTPENPKVSYLSFAYGRSLWAELNGGENLFTGRQTCSLYLVLWLCDVAPCKNVFVVIKFSSFWGHIVYEIKECSFSYHQHFIFYSSFSMYCWLFVNQLICIEFYLKIEYRKAKGGNNS